MPRIKIKAATAAQAAAHPRAFALLQQCQPDKDGAVDSEVWSLTRGEAPTQQHAHLGVTLCGFTVQVLADFVKQYGKVEEKAAGAGMILWGHRSGWLCCGCFALCGATLLTQCQSACSACARRHYVRAGGRPVLPSFPGHLLPRHGQHDCLCST